MGPEHLNTWFIRNRCQVFQVQDPPNPPPTLEPEHPTLAVLEAVDAA